MRIVRNIQGLAPAHKGAAIAIGNFDGLHKGHHAVLRRMMEQAERMGVPKAVMTFEPHPRRFFKPDLPIRRIYPLHHKLRLLEMLGVEIVYLLPFNAQMADLSAQDFMQQILQDGLEAKTVITGYDFCFGKGRSGNCANLQGFAEQTDAFSYEAVEAQKLDEEIYSSTAIRGAIEEGNMEAAARLLGRPYSVIGRVKHGDARGREMGFPTANISLPTLLKPAYGVYAVRVSLPDGKLQNGVANWGVRPTMDGMREWLEVHLFDFKGDLYGQRLEVALMSKLRNEQRFDSLDALKAQIAKDCSHAKEILGCA